MNGIPERELEHIFARLKRFGKDMQEDERFTIFRGDIWFNVMKYGKYDYKLHFRYNDLRISKILLHQEAINWWKARCFEMYKELVKDG